MTTNEQPSDLETIEKPPKKCLFIDDHFAVIESAKYVFKDIKNLTTAECHSVEEALNAIRANKPDVIFLDHSLTIAGSEGLEVAKIILVEMPETKIYSTTTNPRNDELYEQIGVGHIDKSDLGKIIQIAKS